MDRASLGLYGEGVAERHLVSRGCRILDRRWRTTLGEIDLVADERGEIVFVEVKTRRGSEYGPPEDAVTAKKRAHLRAVAAAYLAANDLGRRPFRIDIIAVTVSAPGESVRLAHFRSAVGEAD